MTAARLSWPPIVARAREIVDEYNTGVTLRQLFYRLVSEQLITNKQTTYRTLSSRTADARRRGEFPDLIDRTRNITVAPSFEDTYDARAWLADLYRRDRTEGQPWSIYLGVEKTGMIAQLESWFSVYGIPILALGGYASQTYVDEIAQDVHARNRPAVLLYAGDFDASGEDISRDFVKRTGCFSEVHRIALTAEQVAKYKLPPQPGKKGDTRAASFVKRHGKLVQVELDALPPATVRSLYAEAVADYWDADAYDKVRAREHGERLELVPA